MRWNLKILSDTTSTISMWTVRYLNDEATEKELKLCVSSSSLCTLDRRLENTVSQQGWVQVMTTLVSNKLLFVGFALHTLPLLTAQLCIRSTRNIQIKENCDSTAADFLIVCHKFGMKPIRPFARVWNSGAVNFIMHA